MTFLLEISMNSCLQTDGHALIEAKRVVSELRPPAALVLHIHRCIGREQQLHHRCFASARCPVQWGVASARRQHTAREGSEAAVFLRNFIKVKVHFHWIHLKDREKKLSAQSWQSSLILFYLFYMFYLQMVNRTCSKPKSLEGAGFSAIFEHPMKVLSGIHPNPCRHICRLNNPKSPSIHVKASYLHLEFGLPWARPAEGVRQPECTIT